MMEVYTLGNGKEAARLKERSMSYKKMALTHYFNTREERWSR
jgi:hypothetical protein